MLDSQRMASKRAATLQPMEIESSTAMSMVSWWLLTEASIMYALTDKSSIIVTAVPGRAYHPSRRPLATLATTQR